MNNDESTPMYRTPFYTCDGEICAMQSVLCKGESTSKGGKPKMVLTESGASWVRFLASLGLGKTAIASVLGTNHHTLGSEINRDRFNKAYSDGVAARKDAVSSLGGLQKVHAYRTIGGAIRETSE